MGVGELESWGIYLSPISIPSMASQFNSMPLPDMSRKENGQPHEEDSARHELQLSDLLLSDTIRELHETINNEWDSLQRTACQTAAGRALWKHVTHDPLAEVLAGETYLRSLHEKMTRDRLNSAREVSGVILAVRTLWFDAKLEAALNSFNGGDAQVVLLGAGMDARAYRLSYLKGINVFEVDFPELLHMKATLLQAAIGSTNEHEQLKMIAKSLTRVAADIREDDWSEKLQRSGFFPERNTVWVLEGILYYLSHPQALQVGDPDANFGLMHDPLNLFNKIRNLPRSVQIHPDDGTPCNRLYLVQATGSPNHSIP
ncbi:putative S-adenosyl-L-methionine-dependent methyltransferase Mjls_1072 isoform X2 [Macadamia integrifolia]|uniref:putative S-adenosyl-L-methionine-dependent methyltransferase Mjls_1072 isoform X2 n=1 Tax=Macadamia integrifolia TaxID=60698 RepID=UPI001C4F7485|nr:putative S-adenosyl-L-methionine-dependent methyltransferase Mjls_1072 isoform X2 [Macadamia integrifolia]